MGLDSGKHTEKEINGIRCRYVETKISKERAEFLKEILEYNGQQVEIEEMKKKKEEDPTLYTIGIQDVTYNVVLQVYAMKLRTPEGHIVTPAYWNQKAEDFRPQYWEVEE